jgi:chromosome segregation ATPase
VAGATARTQTGVTAGAARPRVSTAGAPAAVRSPSSASTTTSSAGAVKKPVTAAELLERLKKLRVDHDETLQRLEEAQKEISSKDEEIEKLKAGAADAAEFRETEAVRSGDGEPPVTKEDEDGDSQLLQAQETIKRLEAELEASKAATERDGNVAEVDATVEELKKEVSSVKQNLRDQEAQLIELKAEKERLLESQKVAAVDAESAEEKRAELKKKDDELTLVRQELLATKSALSSVQKELEDARSQGEEQTQKSSNRLKALEEELTKARQELSSAQDQLVSAKGVNNEELTKSQGSLKALEGQLAAVKSELSGAKDAHLETLATLQAKLQSSENQLLQARESASAGEEAAAERDGLREQLQESKKQIEDLQASAKERDEADQSELSKVTAALHESEEKARKLASDLDQAKHDAAGALTKANEHHAAVEKEVQLLERQLETAQAESQDADKTHTALLEESKATIKKLEEDLRKASASIESSQGTQAAALTAAEEKIKALEADLTKATGEVEVVRREADEERKRKTEEIAKVTEMVHKMHNDNTEEIAALKGKLAEAQSAGDDGKLRVEQYEREIKELKQQLAEDQKAASTDVNGHEEADARLQNQVSALEEGHAKEISRLTKEHALEYKKSADRIKELESLASRVEELERDLKDSQFALQESQKAFAAQLEQMQDSMGLAKTSSEVSH